MLGDAFIETVFPLLLVNVTVFAVFEALYATYVYAPFLLNTEAVGLFDLNVKSGVP